MTSTNTLINSIVEAIQNKKGRQIVVADLTKIDDTICNYLIICQGNSNSQVASIVENVRDEVKLNSGEAALAIDGLKNAEWVAMDYADVIVHVFLPDVRAYYNLETLWADAKLNTIPDLD